MVDTRYALLTCIAIILLASANALAAEPKGPAAKATSWVLERGRDIPPRLKRTPQLHMEGEKLSGSTGCNSFTAAVVDKADKRIAIEQVALTRKLCAAKLDQAETAFVRALDETAYLEQKGSKLIFLSGKRLPLLVWTRSKSAAQRASKVRDRRRLVRVSPRQRSARTVYRGCLWGDAAGRGRVF